MAKECTQCKRENPSVAVVCMFCGAPFVETILTEEEKQSKKITEKEATIHLYQKQIAEMEATIRLSQKKLDEAQQKNDSSKDIQTKAEPVQNANKSFPVAVLVVGLTLFFAVTGWVSYFKFYKPWDFERKAPRYYTYANSVFLRSSQLLGVEHNILKKLPYGTELIMLDLQTDWSYVKWKNPQNKESIEGYISVNYILPISDFNILNSIWGDNESKETISASQYRKALLLYIKEKGDTGRWQVFSKSKEIKPNTTYYDRITNRNSKFPDFAVIIKNMLNGNRKCLIFTFDDDETPHFVYEEDAPATGDISSIKMNNGNYNISYRQ